MPADAPFLQRIECWEDTQKLAALAPAPPASVKHRWTADDPPPPRRHARTAVAVVQEDTIDCALRLRARGFNPAALNLSDPGMPGGCVAFGSGAQEESLFRRTNLCRTLTLHHYPVLPGETVYSGGVRVFKTSEDDGWRPVPGQPTVDFIACPAVRQPQCDNDGRMRDADAEAMRLQIAAVLHTALAHGHDSVVLGAMGCGAFKCPAPHVAEIMRREIQRFDGTLRAVAIAITRGSGDCERSRRNFGVFEETFRTYNET